MGKEDQEDEDYQSRIRHDFRNKIQIIQGYLQLLMDEDLPESADPLIQKSMKATKESKELLEEWKKAQLERED